MVKSGNCLCLAMLGYPDRRFRLCDITSDPKPSVKVTSVLSLWRLLFPLQSSRCRYNARKVGAKCRGYQLVGKSESSLLRAVATVGPIAVAVDASRPSFRYDDWCVAVTRCATTIHCFNTWAWGLYLGPRPMHFHRLAPML